MGLLNKAQGARRSGKVDVGKMEVTTEYRAIFAEEAGEHLQEWERSLLSLEKTPEERGLLDQMFRAIHTLKGSAGFISYEELQRLTHELESSLQAVRDGAVVLSPRIIEILFQGLDLSRKMVESFVAGKQFEEDTDSFLQSLSDEEAVLLRDENRGTGAGGGQQADLEDRLKSKGEPSVLDAEEGETHSSANRVFQLELLIQSRGREAFLRAFLIRNRLSGIAMIQSENPAPEILRDSGDRFAYKIIVETGANEQTLREVLNIDLLEIISIEEIKQTAHCPRPEKEIDKQDSSRPPTVSTIASETAARAAKPEEVVRVAVEKLDTLLNLVGELVIQNSSFVSIAEELKARYGKVHQIAQLEEKTEELAKITRDLQDGIMKVRMLPVTNVFSRFYRVVRDLAKDRKKEIALEIFGEETEIDKKVMDRIGDPLVHLVRNAVDHGIEDRDQRLKAGKAPVGRIRLGAYQDGDHICIEVSDDGRGLDRNAVVNKAVEKGLVRQEETDKLSEEQMLNLIFLPGFSTAREVTEVSGRGVGMDVVKRAIEEMGGSVRIRSFAGRGTKVTISLPLTMAIIPAVLVEVERSILAIPLSSVREVLKVGKRELKSVGARPAIRLREEVLAMVHLQEALSLGGNGSSLEGGQRKPVAVVEYEGKKIGLGVDRVLGTGEIVIKSLSRHYREIEGLIGASIMGNGKIALIVDVEAMVRQYYHISGGGASVNESGIVDVQSICGALGSDAEVAEATLAQHEPGEEGGIQVEELEAGAPAPDVPERQTDDQAQLSQEEIEEALSLVPEKESEERAAAAQEGGQQTAGDEPHAAPAEGEDLFAESLASELKESGGVFLEEIHNAGAIQASMSLSQLTGMEIRVSFPESQLVELGEVADALGGEEKPVAGIYVAIEGGLDGGILLVIPEENLRRIHELLNRNLTGSSASKKKNQEMDLSRFSEFGNILAASFINAMSDWTMLTVRSEAPEISVDMCLAVIDTVLGRFSLPGERILLTRAMIFGQDSEQVVCYLLMFLEPESLHKLMQSLADNFSSRRK